MTLEDKLVEGLVEKYKESGRNVQRVLDNSLFKSLPLEAKVRALNAHNAEFSHVPSFSLNDFSNISKAGVTGAAGGAVGYLAPRVLEILKHSPGRTSLGRVIEGLMASGVTGKSLGIAAGVTGVAGLAVGTYGYLKNRSRDSEVAKDVAENKYLSALVNRSLNEHDSSLMKGTMGAIKGPVGMLSNYATFKAENH